MAKYSKKTIIPHKKYEIIAFYYFFNFRASSKQKQLTPMPLSAVKIYLILNFKSGAYLFEFSFSDDEVGNQNGCACDKP